MTINRVIDRCIRLHNSKGKSIKFAPSAFSIQNIDLHPGEAMEALKRKEKNNNSYANAFTLSPAPKHGDAWLTGNPEPAAFRYKIRINFINTRQK